MLAGVTPQWLRGMFSRIARRYDLTNTIISAGLDHAWRRRLAQRVARHTARLILDVACGTGGVMVQLARCCPPTTRLIGVDFTEAMLHVGRQRLATTVPSSRLYLCSGDAQCLPCPDTSFDVVTMMFGVRNFDDPVVGLAECYRVLRPEGHLCFVEFTWPRRRGLQMVYGGYLRYILPLIAWPLCGERTAYRYLRDSVLAFRHQPDLTALLQRIGFTDISAEALSGGITTLYEARKPAFVFPARKETPTWQQIGV
jgi:demethylmenaquinone methyltransferase / 2-methoxy-6-polyprenyl-1,4-benzoquinol methylase